MDYFLEEELMMMLPGMISGLISGIPAGLFSIVIYVLSALAIYSISRRRGLHKPWLAWIPVVNVWLLGSLSDQYRYVVKGENKAKRKWLLVLNILQTVLAAAVIALCVVLVVFLVNEDISEIIGLAMAVLGMVLPMIAASIAYCVIRYMALYDVYRSLDPNNSVLYLVLSILFNPTEPFFLFFNRDKDLGMPPRKQQPVHEQDNDYVTVDDPEYV